MRGLLLRGEDLTTSRRTRIRWRCARRRA